MSLLDIIGYDYWDCYLCGSLAMTTKSVPNAEKP